MKIGQRYILIYGEKDAHRGVPPDHRTKRSIAPDPGIIAPMTDVGKCNERLPD
jgi:hypothetical protein